MSYSVMPVDSESRAAFGERSALLLEQALSTLENITVALSLQGDGTHMQTRAAIAAELDGARDDAELLAIAARWVDTLHADVRRRQHEAETLQVRPSWRGLAAEATVGLRLRLSEWADRAIMKAMRWGPLLSVAVIGLAGVAAVFELGQPGSVTRWLEACARLVAPVADWSVAQVW